MRPTSPRQRWLRWLCHLAAAGVWRNGSASDSRSEGWEFESLCPHSQFPIAGPKSHPITTFRMGVTWRPSHSHVLAAEAKRGCTRRGGRLTLPGGRSNSATRQLDAAGRQVDAARGRLTRFARLVGALPGSLTGFRTKVCGTCRKQQLRSASAQLLHAALSTPAHAVTHSRTQHARPAKQMVPSSLCARCEQNLRAHGPRCLSSLASLALQARDAKRCAAEAPYGDQTHVRNACSAS